MRPGSGPQVDAVGPLPAGLKVGSEEQTSDPPVTQQLAF
jgi:hypothetical protein